MAAETTTRDTADAEAALVLSWRFDVLLRAGYGREEAFVLARAAADLHLATRLLALGCPPRTALRILL
jgi:hypothetical protein